MAFVSYPALRRRGPELTSLDPDDPVWGGAGLDPGRGTRLHPALSQSGSLDSKTRPTGGCTSPTPW